MTIDSWLGRSKCKILSNGDGKRNYDAYWPTAAIWKVDERALTPQHLVTRFQREGWTWAVETKTVTPPEELAQEFGAISVHLVT